MTDRRRYQLALQMTAMVLADVPWHIPLRWRLARRNCLYCMRDSLGIDIFG
jgi:hypothetical protein